MMQTICDLSIAEGYKSPSQVARVVTEGWAAANLYCAACPADSLKATRANSNACDFSCPRCAERYELKSVSRWNDNRIVDSGYNAMVAAIRGDKTPNLLVLHRDASWQIERLLLIPRFFFSESVIEKRKPLAATARRAGWVGCNIVIGQIAAHGKIPMVHQRSCIAPATVRRKYKQLSGLAHLRPEKRGWTLDVLERIERLPKRFQLAEAYAFEGELEGLHPGNRHVREKIRQQLQVLRDLGLLKFVSSGWYERQG